MKNPIPSNFGRRYSIPLTLTRRGFVALGIMALQLVFPTLHAAEKQPNAGLSFYCVAYAAESKTIFVKTAPERYESVGLSTANIVEASGVLLENGRVHLYGTPGEDGKHSLVGEVDLGGIVQPLIILHPAPDAGGMTYQTRVIDATLKKFPLGSFHLENLTPYPVRLVHQDINLEIESAGNQNFIPDEAAGESVAVELQYKVEENWVMFSSTRLAARNDRRTLVTFLVDPVSKRVSVKSISLKDKSKR